MTLIPDELKALQEVYGWGNAAMADLRVWVTKIGAIINVEQPPIVFTPLYSQRNPLWASLKLGSGNTTIGQEGCLMTCAAMMLAELGHGTTPAELNYWLMANGGYVTNNHFVFASIDKLGVTKFRILGSCATVPAPMNVIERAVIDGYVFAQVDFTPGGVIQQHWVIYRGDGKITDPWNGDNASITRYGKDAATAIMGYAIWDRVKGV